MRSPTKKRDGDLPFAELRKCTAQRLRGYASGVISCPRTELTDAQREVLVMLLESPQPSQPDIAARLGISVESVADRVFALEKKGAVRRGPERRTCGIEVLLPGLAMPDVVTTAGGIRMGRVWP